MMMNRAPEQWLVMLVHHIDILVAVVDISIVDSLLVTDQLIPVMDY